MARWMEKLRKYKVPEARAQSVYSLHNAHFGKVVYVVAPGPTLDEFPRAKLDDFPTIAVNSAAELISPTYWLFQEGIFCKKYYAIYTTPWIKRIVTTLPRVEVLQKFVGSDTELYHYAFMHISVLRMKKSLHKFPFWFMPEEHFLPGHNSVAANAISLAVLMGAALIVIVGVDFFMPNGKYYAEGIRRNPGPRLKHKALSASKAWMNLATRKGVWKGPRIVTTSPYLRMRGIQRVTPEEALRLSYNLLESDMQLTRGSND